MLGLLLMNTQSGVLRRLYILKVDFILKKVGMLITSELPGEVDYLSCRSFLLSF